MRGRRHLLIALLLVYVETFYIGTIRQGHDWGDDFSMYIHHAKNLAEGRPYADTGYIYNPSYPTLGPKVYPPGFPLLLAPIYYWFGLNLTAMKVEIVILFGLWMWVLWLSFRSALPFAYVAVWIGLVALNPLFWDFKDSIVSDIPLALLMYLSLYWIQQAEEYKRSRWLLLGIGLGLYLSFATRAAGIILVPCLLAYDFLRHRRLTWFTLSACGLALLLGVAQHFLIPGEGSYLDQLRANPMVWARNAVEYGKEFRGLFGNGHVKWISWLLTLFTGALAVFGYARKVKSGPTVYEIFAPAYITLIVIWPANQGFRFLVPLIPLYFYYAASGMLALRWRVPALALLACIGISYAAQYSTVNFRTLPAGVSQADFTDLCAFLKTHTGQHDRLVSIKPRLISLWTGREAGAYHRAGSDDLWDYVRQLKASYIVVGICEKDDFCLDQQYLVPMIRSHGNQLSAVYSNPTFTIYKLI